MSTSTRGAKKAVGVVESGSIDVDIDDKKTKQSTYQRLMIEYPYLANATQSAVISSASVLVSQYLAGNSQIDWSEVRTVAFIGAAGITPVLLIFYSRLHKMQLGVLGKLLLDQLIFSPIFTMTIITLRLIVMQRVPFSDYYSTLAAVVPKAVLSSWTFWVPARGFTLLIVPVHLHLITGSMFSFMWNIILSMLLNA